MTVAEHAPNTGPTRVQHRHLGLADAPVRRGLVPLRLPGEHGPVTVSSLGTGFLGLAATSLAVLLLLFDVVHFALEFRGYPSAGPAVLASAAWLLLAGLLVALALASRAAGDKLSPLTGSLLLAGLAVVVALDIAAVLPRGDLGRDLTAAPAVGLVLLAMVGVRSARSVMVAGSVLGVVIVVGGFASWVGRAIPPVGLESLASTACRAALPPIVAAVIVAVFRRIVARELERTLVQSTVSAPRYAVGMLASEELARLDLAAEQLLDDVATGRSRLPLNPASAQAAASLATELRLHLIEGRRQTWLYHAISESDVLGRLVSLSDPDSVAGLLDARQRDGLLQTVWLLLGDSPDRSRRSATRVTIEVTVGSAQPVGGDAEKRMHIPITLTTTGIPRNRVDPGTWNAVRKVGSYTDLQRGGSLALSIDCTVERPVEW
ncbi:hypothetical protein [uncultured Amnibacterium sp.]|uniref:hypothetical protein n=1 Tax=uncultured Amnibacterium sp. TaxID=1631851 RepID=UPI0035C9E766